MEDLLIHTVDHDFTIDGDEAEDAREYLPQEKDSRIIRILSDVFLTSRGELFYGPVADPSTRYLIETPEPIKYIEQIQSSYGEEDDPDFELFPILLAQGFSDKIYEIKTRFTETWELTDIKIREIAVNWNLKTFRQLYVNNQSLVLDRDGNLLIVALQNYHATKILSDVKFSLINVEDLSCSLVDEKGILYIIDQGLRNSGKLKWFDQYDIEKFPTRYFDNENGESPRYRVRCLNTVLDIKTCLSFGQKVVYLHRNGILDCRNPITGETFFSYQNVTDVRKDPYSDGLDFYFIMNNNLYYQEGKKLKEVLKDVIGFDLQ